MTFPDLGLDAKFRDPQGRDSNGFLHLTGADSTATLSFYPGVTAESARPAIQRRTFSKSPTLTRALPGEGNLFLDPQNQLLIQLSFKNKEAVTIGSKLDRFCFTFRSARDRSLFMEALVQKVRIVQSEVSSDLYVLKPIVRSRAAFSVRRSPGVSRSHRRTELTAWSGLTQRLDFIPTVITAENLDPELFYNAEFDSSVIFDVLRMLLEPSRDILYSDVRKQWSLLSRRQFMNSPDISEVIRKLESEIKGKSRKFEGFENPGRIKTIVFEVLLTYSLYNCDGTKMRDGMTDLLLPFVDAYIRQYGYDDDRCASEVFGVFAEFYERHKFGEIRADPSSVLPPRLRERIESMFGELLEILTEKHICSLDFLARDCSRWFVDVFEGEDLKILWISILTFGNRDEFFESFLIALLLLLIPELYELIPLSSQEFVDRFNEVKVRVDLRTLLVNTKEIHGMCYAAV
jgi:hypothetical protein